MEKWQEHSCEDQQVAARTKGEPPHPLGSKTDGPKPKPAKPKPKGITFYELAFPRHMSEAVRWASGQAFYCVDSGL